MKLYRSMAVALCLAAIGLLVQACAPKLPVAEDACGFAQNSYGERLSWKHTVPVTLYIHESVPKEHHSSIIDSIDEWNRQSGRHFFRFGGVMSDRSKPGRDNISMIYWMKEWKEENAAEQGRTWLYFSGNRITEADIYINAKHYEFYSFGYQSNAVHLKSLMVHELGHVLGLAHVNHSDSIMLEYLRKNVERDQIGTADLEALGCEY